MSSEYAILLFYHYHPTDAPPEAEWHRAACARLALCGRLRVAPQGLNGTLSGRRAQLLEYAAAYTRRAPSAASVDWKLSAAAEEQCFRSLSVRVVREVVSLGVPATAAPPEGAAAHLRAEEFDAWLRRGGGREAGGKVVLLDTRNCYEWGIGRFEAGGVATLLPPIRQFSEWPRWLEGQLAALEGCTVLMYCTGGVRCETASSYLRQRAGGAVKQIFQLYGGIERYLDAFPSGGFFRGKNLVFDKRLAVGPAQAEVVGRCFVCASPADDYSRQRRCAHCRLLLLSAASFRGRSAQLQRKLRGHARLVFVDAPHRCATAGEARAGEARGGVLEGEAGRRGGGGAGGGRYSWLRAEGEEGVEGRDDGWGDTVAYLRGVFRDHGPFDGLLGFSLGAAAAAGLAALQAQRAADVLPIAFRFVVLVSGHSARDTSIHPLLSGGAIPCPSLHVFGRADEVVAPAASENLADCFSPEMRSVLQHHGGHILPATDACVKELINFFRQFTPGVSVQAYQPVEQACEAK
ncbi:hypothetical protein AB1Y20_006194 [Prymnesium parvum]|uniref:Rhodanese domain-containing protein n=1 Tax=Prymnesium parvum TaxID=97485 RepID=A0AB34J149_PRYPA